MTTTTPADASGSGSFSGSVRELIGIEVLVIDKDSRVRDGMAELLSQAKLHVTCVDDPNEAWSLIDNQFFSVVIVDLDTPSANDGIETVRTLRIASPTSMVIMLTPRKSFGDAVESIRAGAVDVILKSPDSVKYLHERVLSAAGRSQDEREVDHLLTEVSKTQQGFLQLLMDCERRALDLEDELKGRSPLSSRGGDFGILVVANDDALVRSVSTPGKKGFAFAAALSGGQALDVIGSGEHQVALISDNLRDLPTNMVIRSIKAQYPAVTILKFTGPGEGGKIEIADTETVATLLDPFTDPRQLLDVVEDLAAAYKARMNERRYTQAFRERHYDFLRKFVELRSKIDRALSSD